MQNRIAYSCFFYLPVCLYFSERVFVSFPRALLIYAWVFVIISRIFVIHPWVFVFNTWAFVIKPRFSNFHHAQTWYYPSFFDFLQGHFLRISREILQYHSCDTTKIWQKKTGTTDMESKSPYILYIRCAKKEYGCAKKMRKGEGNRVSLGE